MTINERIPQTESNPKIIAFLCNWCSYAGGDLAGTARIHHDITARVVRVMCSGRVEPSFVLKAFQEGAAGVIIAGCHIPADCHYTSGNFKALKRYETFLPLLEELGIEKERLRLEWISASEGEKYARVMNEFAQTIRSLGPLKLNRDGLKKTCQQKAAAQDECSLIKKAQEFIAADAASSQMVDLERRKTWNFPEQKMEPSIVHNPNKCVRCGSCVEACKLQGVEALSMDEEKGVVLDESKCVRCGQCIMNCPMGFPEKVVNNLKIWLNCGNCQYCRPIGAMIEQDDTDKVIKALQDPDKYVVVEMAPAVRATLGEEFGTPPGTVIIPKLYSALKNIGFDHIWDTNFTADLTIMEESNELIDRLLNKKILPQFTSCCPAWIKFCETYYPELIPHLSSAKSPQQMFGAVAKSYAAKKLGIDPEKMFVVSIMPCTAKKFECSRTELKDADHFWTEHGKKNADFPDVDVVLTTRECAKLLKNFKIDLMVLPDGHADSLLGGYTGAATIFGRTGGVMTAALRTACEVVTNKPLPDLELTVLGGYEGIKTATVPVGDIQLKVAVAFGLKNARIICEDIKNGGEFSKYHFIEIMTCPGGCVGGGGQIITTDVVKIKARTLGLNVEDQELTLRKSHENPEVKQIYTDFLEKPCSSLSHYLLHTHYQKRDIVK